MDKMFYRNNRQSLYDTLAPNSLVVLYAGHAPRKTADEKYPFFADRSFVYMTGVAKESLIMSRHSKPTLLLRKPCSFCRRMKTQSDGPVQESGRKK